MAKCPKNQNDGRRNEARAHVNQAEDSPIVGDNIAKICCEQGQNLMFKRVLLKSEKKNC